MVNILNLLGGFFIGALIVLEGYDPEGSLPDPIDYTLG